MGEAEQPTVPLEGSVACRFCPYSRDHKASVTKHEKKDHPEEFADNVASASEKRRKPVDPEQTLLWGCEAPVNSGNKKVKKPPAFLHGICVTDMDPNNQDRLRNIAALIADEKIDAAYFDVYKKYVLYHEKMDYSEPDKLWSCISWQVYKKACTDVGIPYVSEAIAKDRLMSRIDLRVYLVKVMVRHQVERHNFLARSENVLGRGSIVIAKLPKSDTLWRGAVERATVFHGADEPLAYKLAGEKYVSSSRIVEVLYHAPVEPMAAVTDDLADSWPSWPSELVVGDDGKIMTAPVDLRAMLLEAGKSEADIGSDPGAIVRMAHSHLAELSNQYVKWVMAQLNPEASA